MAIYDDLTFVGHPAEAKPRSLAALLRSRSRPAPPHFYSEYGPDYEERYNWRLPPTTGAYFVKDEDIVKGASITLTRVKDWWAKDRKFYRHRFNADKIVYPVVRDESKVWELFRAGEIDFFMITSPQYWYEKSEIPPVFDGYIERYIFYNQFPRPPYGLYLNTAKPLLDDRNVRLGIPHAMNWQKVHRRDLPRRLLAPAGLRSTATATSANPDVNARPFSVVRGAEVLRAGRLHRGGGRTASCASRTASGSRSSVSYPTNTPIVEQHDGDPQGGGEEGGHRPDPRRAGAHGGLQEGDAEGARDGVLGVEVPAAVPALLRVLPLHATPTTTRATSSSRPTTCSPTRTTEHGQADGGLPQRRDAARRSADARPRRSSRSSTTRRSSCPATSREFERIGLLALGALAGLRGDAVLPADDVLSVGELRLLDRRGDQAETRAAMQRRQRPSRRSSGYSTTTATPQPKGGCGERNSCWRSADLDHQLPDRLRLVRAVDEVSFSMPRRARPSASSASPAAARA